MPPSAKPPSIRMCASCGSRFSADAAFCPFDGSKLSGPSPDVTGDPLLGTTVDGRYEMLDRLGEGGMGRVYRVRHVSLGRPFAMKVLRRELAADEDLARRFTREAQATAAVRHPNVVQITDFGVLPSKAPYFVMEQLSGRTLRDVLGAGAMPVSEVLPIVKQVASALGAAHDAGVIHRDLKPDNVFLLEPRFVRGRDGSPPPEVRVVDFGASKIIGASSMTRKGIVYGTPHYMAPEQAAGQEIDRRADVYALGVLMYEMLTGRRPFEADTYMNVLTQHMFSEPVPPSRVEGALGAVRPFEPVVLACLSKTPDARPGSMGDLVRELERAASVGPPDRDAPATSEAAEPPDLSETAVVPMRRIPWGGVTATAAGIALISIGVIAMGRSSDGTPARPPADVETAAPLALPYSPSAASYRTSIPPEGGRPSPAPSSEMATLPPGFAASSSIVPSVRASKAPARPARPRTRPPASTPIDDIGDPFARR